MTDGQPILVVHDVSKSFGGVAAVDGASFDVAPSSLTALVGPNGAGKSTLFNVVSGFEAAQRGEILFRGQSIFGVGPHQIARRGLVRTFQLTKSFNVMSVVDNMLVAGPRNPGAGLFGAVFRTLSWVRHERLTRRRALELLDAFGLAEKANDYAGTLSGGQRKLLELARALMLEPEMVLLDEPLAGVNPTLGQRLLDHIQRLRDEAGTTFLFVEHDMDVVMEHADHVVVMAQGRVIAAGTPALILREAQVIDAYLGIAAEVEPPVSAPSRAPDA